MKDLHTKNYKTLIKDILKDFRGKDRPCSKTGKINIVKMSILSKTIWRFNAVTINISMIYFTKIEQVILNCLRSHKRPRVVKTFLKKKYKPGGIKLPDFQLYYKSIAIKNWHIQIHGWMGQNREFRNKSICIWSFNLWQTSRS